MTYAQALKCKLNGTLCTFSQVRTSKSDVFFNPSAEDNNAVKTVRFEDSVMPILTNELCKVFPNLKVLYVDQLLMEQIESNALHECKKLTSLSFFGNKLKNLDQNLFEGNPELTGLVISNNLLNTIDGKLFKHIKKLEWLYLSDNFLTEIPLDQFPRLENLEYLSINDVKDLDHQDLLQKLPNLKEIYMHNNVFDCDRLRIILDVLRKNKVQLKAVDKDRATRNTNLNTTIKNVECMTAEKQSLNANLSGKLSHFKLKFKH